MTQPKTHVLVVYGGKSTEHEISCRSAAFVLKNLDPAKYEVHAVAIDKTGAWLPQNTALLRERTTSSVPILRDSGDPRLPALAADPTATLLAHAGAAQERTSGLLRRDLVVFPVLHGTNGEDGAMQGLLDLADVAYVGPDTLGSAVGMDKVVSKRLAQAAGVPVVPWLDTRAQFWASHHEAICVEAERSFGYPMFVKPVRLGSSVGVTKVKDHAALYKACEAALQFDDKIMIEKAMNVREIECAVLGDYDPQVSVPGEVIPHQEFYSYEAKYVDADGASIAIPAKLEPAQIKVAQELSLKVFAALDLYGMARIDLFLERESGRFYFNEVNTIPGFTEISQYPLLWQASGVSARELLDRLVELAVARKTSKDELLRSR